MGLLESAGDILAVLPFLLVAGLACFGSGIVFLVLDVILPWRLKEQHAILIEKTSGANAQATLRFHDESEQEQVVTISAGSKNWRVFRSGDVIPILYRGSAPQSAVVAFEPHPARAPLLLAAGLLLMGGPLLLMIVLGVAGRAKIH